MTVKKFTPGPWERNGKAVHKRVSKQYATCICVCEGDDRYINAGVIASLPYLLEALEAFIEADNTDGINLAYAMAKAAIAKAYGEPAA